MVRQHVFVEGRVQGVGYRQWVKERAERMGIRGWIRNNDDESVEVLAEGEPTALETFKDLLKQGPTGAHVERLQEDHTPGAATGEFDGFGVR
jgi:acylphosphatase